MRRLVLSFLLISLSPVCCAAAIAAGPATPPGPAAPRPLRKLAVTDREFAGPSIDIQGEYLGDLPGEENKPHRVGVQVVAHANHTFDAVLFEGGLPGMGWTNGKSRLTAHGQLGDAGTVLVGKDWKATVPRGENFLLLEKGKQTARLKKVQRQSPTLGLKPPKGAVHLFDGTGVEHWTNGTLPLEKLMSPEKLLQVGGTTKDTYRDFTMHVEFLIPFEPENLGQARCNSGLFLQSRYELQVLDSFGLVPIINDCGAIYHVKIPDINASFPPLTWQTYDVEFRAARFNDKKVRTEPAKITVKQNGITIHDNLVLDKMSPNYVTEEYPGVGPLFVQNHGDPVQYRNFWLLEHKE